MEGWGGTQKSSGPTSRCLNLIAGNWHFPTDMPVVILERLKKNCGSQQEGVPRVRHPQEDEGASSVGDHPYCQAAENEDPRGGGRGHPYHSVALLPQPRAHHQEVTQKAHPQPEDGLC